MGVISSAQDPDPDTLDPQNFDFLDLDLQKYADPCIRIQGPKPKPTKNFFTLQAQI